MLHNMLGDVSLLYSNVDELVIQILVALEVYEVWVALVALLTTQID